MSRPKEPPVEHTPPTPEELSAAPTRDAGATPASGDAGSLIELPSVLTLPKNPPPAGESPDD